MPDERRQNEARRIKPGRGFCQACGYSFRLRANGLIGTHRLYIGSDRQEQPCPGSGIYPQALVRRSPRSSVDRRDGIVP